MDPDETLRRIRDIVRKVRSDSLSGKDTQTNLDMLAEQVGHLDGWLGNGGFAPAAWNDRKPFELPRTRKMRWLGMEVSDRILQLIDTADDYTRGDLQGVTEVMAYDLVNQVFHIAQSSPEIGLATPDSGSPSAQDLIAKATPRPASPSPQARTSGVADDRTGFRGVDGALDL